MPTMTDWASEAAAVVLHHNPRGAVAGATWRSLDGTAGGSCVARDVPDVIDSLGDYVSVITWSRHPLLGGLGRRRVVALSEEIQAAGRRHNHRDPVAVAVAVAPNYDDVVRLNLYRTASRTADELADLYRIRLERCALVLPPLHPDDDPPAVGHFIRIWRGGRRLPPRRRPRS